MNILDTLFGKPEPPPRVKIQDPKPDCKHFKAHIYGWCAFGNAFCPDCNAQVGLDDVLNNFLDEMRKELKR